MAYVPVPKDLTTVKTKIFLNLTKRQLICFGGGALVGLPLFFFLKKCSGGSVAAICMIVVMLPFFLLGMYEKNGLPMEKIFKSVMQVCFLRPKIRQYKTNNFYDCLARQDSLDKEAARIVKNKKEKTQPRRAKTAQSGNRKGKAHR